MDERLFIGIDIGTQGVRIMSVTETGKVVTALKRPFKSADLRIEQDTLMWKILTEQLLAETYQRLSQLNCEHQVISMAVTATSGTVIPLDENNVPLHQALMYSDTRSQAISVSLQSAFPTINSSYGLAKIAWFNDTYPEKAKKIKRWVHAADYINGCLTADYSVTDPTSALKTGYDVQKREWSKQIEPDITVLLPSVQPSGTSIGPLSDRMQKLTGFSSAVTVRLGMTDGCASQIASGCSRPGDWCSTIGTTLVLKGITEKLISDESDVIYNHCHPDGYWMPGGASNTGTDWIQASYTQRDLELLTAAAEPILPTGLLSYPLMIEGERFPFTNELARGFLAATQDKTQLFASQLEGVAYLEKMAYQMLLKIDGVRIKRLFIAGGSSQNQLWNQIRADVLAQPLYKSQNPEGAVGAAIIAASHLFGSLSKAVDAMVTVDSVIYPTKMSEKYKKTYGEFIATLAQKKYIKAVSLYE